ADPAVTRRPATRLGGDLVAGYVEAIRAGVARWAECGARVDTFLKARPLGHGALAVYGAGVFGSYLALSAGAARESIACFLDQGPFKIGKHHLGRPILHPRAMPADVTDDMVGLTAGGEHDILVTQGMVF